MKFFDSIVSTGRKFVASAKEVVVALKDKALGLLVVGSATVGAVQSKAAIVVDPATGVMSGAMEMGPFFGGVLIAATAIGVMLSVFLGLKALKKVA